MRSWPREHSLAVAGAAATAAVSFVVGLLAIDGLSARDSLVVIVPMVAAGAWIGGGDSLAVMWQHSRRRRVVVDVGSTRVVADMPSQVSIPGPEPEPESPTIVMQTVQPDA